MIEDLVQPRHLIVLLVIVAPLVASIFYLLMLQRALERCSAQSRTIGPGMVWLMLIPLFNLVWHFILIGHISRSLRNEFNLKGTPGVAADPGKSIGLVMCILAASSIIPSVGRFAAIASLICWIVYWVKIAGYSQLLLAPAVGSPTA